MNSANIVQKIWSYCDVLRDVGVSYGDYLEQLTYLLFLKMADEYGKPPLCGCTARRQVHSLFGENGWINENILPQRRRERRDG